MRSPQTLAVCSGDSAFGSQHKIGGWGGESFVTPNREIVSFRSCVRASERARDQRFDAVARAVGRPVCLLLRWQNHAGGLSTKNVVFNKVL